MHYIIMDLEWNNTYAKKVKSFINEVIEVGAVMLDENFDCIDEFSSFVRSQIGRKLRTNVKKLTNISNDDIRHGESFTKVMSDFRAWIGDEENVVMTWGDGDIRVLIENYRYLNGIEFLPFLGNYLDLQLYFEKKKELSRAQQIGLTAAAEMVGIDVEAFSHHRALGDSLITAECFRRIFDRNDFFSYVCTCDRIFYEKLRYRPHAISNINSPLVDRSLLDYTCEECKIPGQQLTEWRYSNQYFRAIYKCPICGKKVRVSVRYKKYFDRLETQKTVLPYSEEKKVKSGK